jgi:hypothetical protein
VHEESITSLACQLEKAVKVDQLRKKTLFDVGWFLLSGKGTVNLKLTGTELLKDASLYMIEIGEHVGPSLVLSRCFLALLAHEAARLAWNQMWFPRLRIL